MGGVVDAVSDVVGGVVDAVGDVASAVVDTASSVVEAAGNVVNTVVTAAVNDPIGTALKVAAVATGNAELLPAISAGDVVAHGGSLEQAAVAAGTTYVAQGVTNYVSDQLSTPAPVSNPVYDYGDVRAEAPPPPPVVEPPAPPPVAPVTSISDNAPPAPEPPPPAPPVAEAPVVPRNVAPPVADLGEVTITAARPDYNLTDVIPAIGPNNPTPAPAVPPVETPVAPVDATEIPHHDVAPPTETNPLDYIPAVVPTVVPPPAPTGPKILTPLPPTVFGQVAGLVDPGLNPGFITDVPPQYKTTSPVQSKFYWGGHPYQTGDTFNRDLYKQSPGAPATPYGLQELYKPTDINAYLQALGIGPIAPKTGA
jgi:hypothetical protein